MQIRLFDIHSLQLISREGSCFFYSEHIPLKSARRIERVCMYIYICVYIYCSSIVPILDFIAKQWLTGEKLKHSAEVFRFLAWMWWWKCAFITGIVEIVTAEVDIREMRRIGSRVLLCLLEVTDIHWREIESSNWSIYTVTRYPSVMSWGSFVRLHLWGYILRCIRGSILSVVEVADYYLNIWIKTS